MPEIVVTVESEAEVIGVMAACADAGAPVTFRAAGTSLSGQAITDCVLIMLGDGWRGSIISDDGGSITLQPGVIGAEANRRLAPLGRKIGPDPASIDAAMIGGIAANNVAACAAARRRTATTRWPACASSFADGTVLDTRDAAKAAPRSRSCRPRLCSTGSGRAGARARERCDARRAHPPQVRDQEHDRLQPECAGRFRRSDRHPRAPDDRLRRERSASSARSPIGPFPSIAHKASALILFDTLVESVPRRDAPEARAGRRGRTARPRRRSHPSQDKPGMPEFLRALRDGRRGAAGRDAGGDGADALASRSTHRNAGLGRDASLARRSNSRPIPPDRRSYWKMRKGMFPAVGAMRPVGTTVIIEDVAFPIERLAEATVDLQRLCVKHGYPRSDHLRPRAGGQPAFRLHAGFRRRGAIERYRRFMDEMCSDGRRQLRRLAQGRARHRPQHRAVRRAGMGARRRRELMRRIKALFDPQGLLNPGVILNDDPHVHLKNLKPLPAADPLVDKCIECGFCEPKCPTRGLTLSPRQRIVGWREIARLDAEQAREARAHSERGVSRFQHRDLRRLRTVRDGVPGRHQDRPADQGHARTSIRARSAKAAASVAGHHYARRSLRCAFGLRRPRRFDAADGAIMGSMTPVDALRMAARRACRSSRIAQRRRPAQCPRHADPPAPGRQARVVYFPSCAGQHVRPGARRCRRR